MSDARVASVGKSGGIPDSALSRPVIPVHLTKQSFSFVEGASARMTSCASLLGKISCLIDAELLMQ
jgi:hypothetical protein